MLSRDKLKRVILISMITLAVTPGSGLAAIYLLYLLLKAFGLRP